MLENIQNRNITFKSKVIPRDLYTIRWLKYGIKMLEENGNNDVVLLQVTPENILMGIFKEENGKWIVSRVQKPLEKVDGILKNYKRILSKFKRISIKTITVNEDVLLNMYKRALKKTFIPINSEKKRIYKTI